MTLPDFITPRIAASLAVDAGDDASAAVAAEAATRASADTTLSGSVTSEASTRGAADTALSARISALEAGTAGTATVYVAGETQIGTYLGQPLYRKVVNIPAGTVNAGGVFNVAHGISGIVRIRTIYGEFHRTSPSFLLLPLPYPHADNNSHIQLLADATNIILSTNISYVTFDGNVTIEYTKS